VPALQANKIAFIIPGRIRCYCRREMISKLADARPVECVLVLENQKEEL
jgi:hypothetical protein